jgi:hypothetical protein
MKPRVTFGTFVLAAAFGTAAVAESPAAALADGRPWTATTAEGQTMRITFFADGTARMSLGIMSRRVSWQPTADGFCLDSPRGRRCLTLVPTEGGFVGKDGEAVAMTLQR